MDIQTAATTVLTRKYADFTGRARRSEYWFWTLCVFIVSVVLEIIGFIIGTQLIYYVFLLAVLVPNLAVTARRLHDTGRSGWWILIGLIPVIGWIALIVFTVQDSEPQTNQYGPSPKADASFSGYGA